MLFGGVKNKGRAGLVLLLLFFFAASSSLAESRGTKKKLRVFKDRYVIETSETALDQDIGQAGALVLKTLGTDKQRKFKLVSNAKIKKLFKKNAALEADEVGDYDPNDQFCIDMIKSGVAKYCSPDFEIRISDTSANDPQLSSLWGMSALQGINAPSAWDVTTGSNDIVVAVIDTGIDYTHPDLAQNVWVNPGEVAGNGIDDDRNGFVDDVYGWNAVSNNGNPYDDNGHGTHCAGTIGAVGNNARGVVGVNWNVKIMGLKFLNASGGGSLSGAIQAINYMVAMKKRGVNIRVANNSWGGGGFSQALNNAISEANQAGIIFVAAAGNEANDNDITPAYPAGYDFPNVVSVAAVDRDGNLATFSNYGANQVDIAAPGVGILSTYPGNNYASLSGTSMATPHVSGAMALLLAAEPHLTPAQAIERLYLTGRPMASLNGITATGRMLNVSNMLYNQSNPLPAPTPPPVPCAYSVSKTQFAPDPAVADSAILVQSDEYGFQRVDLNFAFPFYGEYVSKIIVSPNGLVYTKSTPAGMDYENQSIAPLFSIAALHTDLTALTAPYGVRVKTAADHVSVFWLAETYDKRGKGDIYAWLTIYANGIIDSFVNIPQRPVLNHIERRATVGVTGPSAAWSTTFAYNDSLDSQFGLRYVPVCNGQDNGGGVATVDKIRVTAAAKKTRRASAVLPGRSIDIDLLGNGSGIVSLQAAFNGKTCPVAANLNFTNGSASLAARMPKVSEEFSNLSFKVGSARKKIDILSIENRRVKRNTRGKRIAAKKLGRYCLALFQSMSYR